MSAAYAWLGDRARWIMEPAGWILYDDSCGICRRAVPFWGEWLRRKGFVSLPLQTPWVRERLATTDEDLLLDLRILLPDGTQHRGPDAFRFALAQVWWSAPLALLSRLPLVRRLFDACYRAFARNRLRISDACGLSPKTGSALSQVDAADRR